MCYHSYKNRLICRCKKWSCYLCELDVVANWESCCDNAADGLRCSGSCLQFFGEQLASATLNLEGIHIVSKTLYLIMHLLFHLVQLKHKFTATVVVADMVLHIATFCCILKYYLQHAVNSLNLVVLSCICAKLLFLKIMYCF